ncbi:vesicle transport protein USE1 [Anthonomus grandis grandis]|uniref:vesicle transport protein USE1 n=1 Tax=Anthonomus grandis grandis TaxID=2921223 RepID=UPI002166574F|nr:vesicle transport protein USE1 [Anthonomus grandis grandis]
MGLSRQEINLRRLLAKCELLSKNQKEDERFEKYISTLEEMVQEVKKNTDTPIESIKNYQSRIKNIKLKLGITTISKFDEFNDPLAMREELLGLRNRNVKQNMAPESADLDQVLKYQEDFQNKIAEEMLEFTKTLKEQSELANKIIKKDTEVVSNSTQLTDQNYSKLMVESTKLAEHTKRAWKCWLWIILAIVFIVFINMVLFMKVMKKSK